MKLKSKLIMSGVALAACAATLTSTTYAWYTTNTSVSADGIQGATATTGDASIFISTDGLNWSQSVTLEKSSTFDTANGGNMNSASLKPVACSTTGTFSLMAGGSAAKTDVLTFYLYFKTAVTGEDVPLYFSSISVANADSSVNQVDNLLNGTSDTSKPAIGVSRDKAKYGVDIVKALGMVTTATTTTYAAGSATGSKEAVQTFTDLQKHATALDDVNVTEVADTNMALNYYNEVMGGVIEKPDSGLATFSQANFTKGASHTKIAVLDKDSGICAVRFDVLLNGWDEYCFDSCKNQRFTISLGFTSDNKVS